MRGAVGVGQHAPDLPAMSIPTSSISVIGPTGKPNAHQRPIDRVDRRPLIEHLACLVEVWRQDPVDIEAWTVAHDDDRLTQAHARARQRWR